MISLKAQLILNRENKRSKETNPQEIERAILTLVDKQPSANTCRA
jgi:hypothetical protein